MTHRNPSSTPPPDLGTSICPLCGKDAPHWHHPQTREVAHIIASRETSAASHSPFVERYLANDAHRASIVSLIDEIAPLLAARSNQEATPDKDATFEAKTDADIMRELRPSKETLDRIRCHEEANAAPVRNMPLGSDVQEATRTVGVAELVERVARIIDPSSWEVMDSHLARMLHAYRNKNVGYDPEQFKHKESMAKAREIIDALSHTSSSGEQS